MERDYCRVIYGTPMTSQGHGIDLTRLDYNMQKIQRTESRQMRPLYLHLHCLQIQRFYYISGAKNEIYFKLEVP